MKLFICDISALRFWYNGMHCPSDFPACSVYSGVHTITETEELEKMLEHHAGNEAFKRPLHILCTRDQNRKSNNMVIKHAISNIPLLGSFVEIEPGICIATPEFCFKQLSTRLSLVKTIQLGYELCATYRELSSTFDCLLHTKSLATPESLRKYVTQIPWASNKSKANRSIRYILPNSDSPMETKMAMLLTLPNSYGGGGLSKALLNEEVSISPASQKILNKRFLKPDLYLPDSKIAVEYESDMFHTGAERITNDSKRRNALLHDGFSVLTVTNRELGSLSSIDMLITTLYKLSGKRRRILVKDFEERQLHLYRELKQDNSVWS